MEFQSIEPDVLRALAERATEEERRTQNPYLKALMARLHRLALELKVALENEAGSDKSRVRSGSNGQGYEAAASKEDTDSPRSLHDSVA